MTTRAKRFTRTLYMHTLDGQPAYYTKTNGQVTFAGRRVNRFASSLRQIRAEQKASEAWRQARGFGEHFRHGHVTLRISPEDIPDSTKEGEPK